ncbi:hypothetical protein [Streptomyces sp. NBC_00859]|uniref:hypothetical protein n=1 Tax=Streptomyces sp. NBC_00859 TaxID=2903682 RepID=UPI003867EC2C|nr:hypothetical protein OG584_33255 [Streptomyces sp. NBC_00859]
MNTVGRAGTYALGLALVFGASLGIGHAVGPVGGNPAAARSAHGPAGSTGPTGAGDAVPDGLQIAEHGYTLVPPPGALPAGRKTDFRFRITGPDGRPVTRYTRSHGKDLHFIVARRDLSGFQHVHPALSADGTWSLPLTFGSAGTYRVFADFVPAGGSGLTLGADVSVAGDYRPTALPAPSRTAHADGYTVTLSGSATAGASSVLTMSVARNGRPITGLQPYLGAYGHLVALRAGDLACLHVHPQGAPGDGTTRSGPGITFHAEFPSAGAYRLYLDFRHRGKVHTAEFTVIAGAPHTGSGSGAGMADHGGHDHRAVPPVHRSGAHEAGAAGA